eukprot:TRINITY_DN18292_c0_g1_i2.p1 TRINITY_DN18292_c0_g1~~TRINITY_DN18292_c0_g1_i2.p1  ORF type:complete len:348 (+),score=17.47 TRINITY_DN18292_c0_g1_i2:101-1144(+)
MADPAAAPVRSFAQAAATEEVAQALRTVQIDGLVALKIDKHCSDWAPQLVTGLLLGLDIGSTLEVTHCFPFPSRSAEEEDAEEADGALYQLEMMRCTREVNVDNNTVGWYQSSSLGAHHTADLIETFLNYRESIKRCVCLVYDADRAAARGALALKALALKAPFMELFKSGAVTGDKLREKNITWADMFEEIPVRMANSTLVTALLASVQPQTTDAPSQTDLARLSLSTNPFMSTQLECLMGCMDDLGAEQQRLQYHYRSVQRQQQQQATWLQKRRSENALRKAAGEEPLPEEDPTNPIFKPIPEPSRIDMLLTTNQIANYCAQLNEFSGPSLSKLYLMDALNGSSA